MNPTTQPPPQAQSQPPPLLPPPPPPQQQQQQQQQPPPQQLLQPHRPSTSCDRHPQENFTGFCPSCLCERLAVLDPNNNNASSSSSARKPPTSSTAAAALKAIFRPSSSSAAPRGNGSSNCNRPPTTSFFPELRRTKSFSASKNEVFSAAFEPQRKSCDVRGRSTLYSLFNQDDERKIPKTEPPRVPPELETRNQGPVIESEEDEEEEEENIVVENLAEDEDEDKDEIRVLEEPNVIEERVPEIVEEEPELEPEPEPEPKPKPEAEVIFAEEESLRPMKEHMDLDSQAKKSSGRDLKEIAGSFWSAASVFSKKLQKWRQKQKAKKRGGPRNGAVSGSSHLLPVEKPIGRQFRETQSEIADYGFGRRSCDTDPRFSLDAARMSLDDPRYSFDEPRASWDGYLIGRTFPRMPLPPTMLSVVEDAPVQHVLRTDTLIPVEDPINENPDEAVNLPGNSAQTREYYSDSSARRRKSLDRSSSIRKTAAAVVAEMDELKPVSNAKVTPAAAADYLHGQKMVFPDRDLRDSNSNSNSNNSLRDDCSESFELGIRDNASVVGNNNNNNGDHRKGSKKSSSKWSKAWSIWGLIHRRGGNNKEEDEDRFSRGGNGNGVERSFSESWQEFRGERNGDVRGGGGGVGVGVGGVNRNMFRSNSSVSWRNAPSMGGGLFGSGRKSDVTANGHHHHGRKGRDEFVLERNRSARYSPNNMDNGLLRLYLARGGSRRNGSAKGRSNQAHSIARSVLRLY